MAFLARRSSVVPLHEIVHGGYRGPRPTVAITFDDAYRSVLERASPILAKYDLPSTLFVPTRWIGERNAWIVPPTNLLEVMDARQILEVERRGIAVESHGHAHINYGTSDPEQIEADVRMSIERFHGRSQIILKFTEIGCGAIVHKGALKTTSPRPAGVGPPIAANFDPPCVMEG